MFVRMVIFSIAQGREAALWAFWEEASAIVRRQPGYIRGRLLRDVADPQHFIELHEWEREEDSAAYRATGEFREVIGRLVALSQEAPLAMGYEVVR